MKVSERKEFSTGDLVWYFGDYTIHGIYSYYKTSENSSRVCTLIPIRSSGLDYSNAFTTYKGLIRVPTKAELLLYGKS